jgi:hypothetical protein
LANKNLHQKITPPFSASYKTHARWAIFTGLRTAHHTATTDGPLCVDYVIIHNTSILTWYHSTLHALHTFDDDHICSPPCAVAISTPHIDEVRSQCHNGHHLQHHHYATRIAAGIVCLIILLFASSEPFSVSQCMFTFVYIAWNCGVYRQAWDSASLALRYAHSSLRFDYRLILSLQYIVSPHPFHWRYSWNTRFCTRFPISNYLVGFMLWRWCL